MVDRVITVTNGRRVVTPFGADAVTLLVGDANNAASAARQSQQQAAEAQAAAASTAASLNGVQETFKGSATRLVPDGNFAALEDADERMMLAFGADGTLIRSNQFIASIVAQAGIDGSSAAIARLPRVPRLLASASLLGITVSGQSNGRGNGGPATTLTQPFSNVMVSADGSALIPLVESGQESSVSATCNAFAAHLRDLVPFWQQLPFNLVGNNMSQGGAPYSALKKGTPAYAQGLQKVQQAKALATAAGLTYAEIAMPNFHGETDAANGVSRATYAGYLPQWKNDWNTDVAAVTDQTNRIPMLIVQKSVSNGAEGASSTTLAQLDAAEADPEIFVIAPGYIADSPDGLHYSAYCQDLFGEYGYKAMRRYAKDGRTPSTVRPISLKRLDGRTIRVTFFVPVPPLVWDMDRVWPIDMGLGFAVRNNADNSTLTLARSPAILPSGYEVDITLAADLPGTPVTVAYATSMGVLNTTFGYGLGRTVGPRGNLRDSDSTPAMFLTDANGRPVPLPNWSAIFEKVI